ncbi:BLUF domain-containing protein [Nocardioides rubriscoriae]|uniref:BLUF domain-containing protein n=1 Tax=Nocardioides rubriscoriae TaxID=642762 RepID=UPI0011DFC39D|nr:BLUF domain-containing protein [Nocardioides rubriscoriae]
MEPLLSLTYVSSATTLFDGAQLLEQLESWRPRNHRRGLTGMLLYSGGNIIQALEGPPSEVEATFETICADPRHRGVIELLREPVTERSFPDWSMGFRDVGPVDVERPDGFNPFLQERDAVPGLPAASAYRLLTLFKKSMR